MLNEPVAPGTTAPGAGAGAAGAGGAPGSPGTQYIQVTPEEREAIDRLCSLGFDRSVVIQVNSLVLDGWFAVAALILVYNRPILLVTRTRQLPLTSFWRTEAMMT